MNLDVSKLAAALACAARGLRVFPLYANSKLPARDDWTERATVDPTQIRSWWVDPVTNAERDLNIGCLTSDWIVPDIDVKEGRDGFSDALELNLDFDTFTVRTPSDGFHLYYQPLPDRRTGQSPLSQGIDVRSFNGYVVGPGSTINGKAYTIEVDGPIAPFPAHLADRLKAPKQKDERVLEDVPWDSLTGIQLAINYVKEMPGIPEGYRGRTCYEAACKLREWAITPERQVELFLEHWNERNGPRMERSEVEFAVRNAFRYATGLAGGKLPSLEFGDLKLTPPPPLVDSEEPTTKAPLNAGFRKLIGMESTPPRKWIVEDMLIPGALTVLVAEGGTGKSILALILAAHLAVGKPFFGHAVIRPGRTLLYSAEDDREEVWRRLNAICMAYELDYARVLDSIYVMTGRDLRMKLVTNRPLVTDASAQAWFIEYAKADPDVQLAIIDPVANVHSINENDAAEMGALSEAMVAIAEQAGIAVLACHHTSKPSPTSPMAYAGNQNAGRGSSALSNAARTILTMFTADAKLRGERSIPTTDRAKYVVFQGAKANMAAGRDKDLWLKFVSRVLHNGDKVGVLMPYDIEAAADVAALHVAALVSEVMLANDESSITLRAASEMAMANDPMCAKEGIGVVMPKLRRLLQVPVCGADGVDIVYYDGKIWRPPPPGFGASKPFVIHVNKPTIDQDVPGLDRIEVKLPETENPP